MADPPRPDAGVPGVQPRPRHPAHEHPQRTCQHHPPVPGEVEAQGQRVVKRERQPRRHDRGKRPHERRELTVHEPPPQVLLQHAVDEDPVGTQGQVHPRRIQAKPSDPFAGAGDIDQAAAQDQPRPDDDREHPQPGEQPRHRPASAHRRPAPPPPFHQQPPRQRHAEHPQLVECPRQLPQRAAGGQRRSRQDARTGSGNHQQQGQQREAAVRNVFTLEAHDVRT